MNNFFSEEVKQIMELAREEAKRLGNNYIGTEHFLLGFIRKRDCSATKLLETIGLDLDALKDSVENFIAPTASSVSDQIPFTPRSKQILASAVDEARALRQEPVGTAHLLLALAQDTEGIAGMMMAEFGASYETLKAELGQA